MQVFAEEFSEDLPTLVAIRVHDMHISQYGVLLILSSSL